MNLKKEVFRNCVPAVLCLVLNGIYTIIDGLFIGQTVGEAGLAAINLVWPVPAVITAAGTTVGVGGGICISLEKGKKNEREIRYILQSVFFLFIVTALLFMAFFLTCMNPLLTLLGAEGEVFVLARSYGMVVAAFAFVQISGSGLLPLLRNAGKPVAAMFAMICGLVGNVCLNYYFIVKKQMGIRGAAWGTVAAQTIVVLLSMYFLFKKKSKRQTHENPQLFRWCRRILINGSAVFGISLLPTWVLALTNYQCLRVGGTAAVAVYAVISYLVFPVQNLLVGIGDGIQPLVSYYEGKQEKETVGHVMHMAAYGVTIAAMICWLLIFLSASMGGALFGLAEENLPDYIWGLKAAAFSFLPYGLSRLQITCMNGRGQSRPAVLLIYGEALLITPFCLFVFPMLWGMEGIWMVPLVSAVICLIGSFLLS